MANFNRARFSPSIYLFPHSDKICFHHSMRTARPQNLRALLVLVACGFLWLWPQAATSQLQRPETCHSCVPGAVREELAIGFHLGQSYG